MTKTHATLPAFHTPDSFAMEELDRQTLLSELSAPARRLNALRGLFDATRNTTSLDRDAAPAVTQRWLNILPKRCELEQSRDVFQAATHRPADQGQACVLIAVMLEGFRVRDDDRTAGYLAALGFMLDETDIEIFDEFARDREAEQHYGLKGFSPEAIAAAIRRHWRKPPFVPTVGEFYASCRDARAIYHGALQDTRRLLRLREDAEFFLAPFGIEPGSPQALDDAVSVS